MAKQAPGKRTDESKERKAFSFRLYPTPEQERYLARVVGSCRYIYNALVREHERRMKYMRTFGAWPKPIGFKTSKKKQSLAEDYKLEASLYEIQTALHEPGGPAPWLEDVAGNIRNHAVAMFGAAQTNWMSGRTGPPNFKQRRPAGSFRFQDTRVASITGGPDRQPGFDFIRIPLPHGIEIDSWICFRRHRRLRGQPKTATIRRAAGIWYVSILCEWDKPAKLPVHRAPNAKVGVDLNVRNLCALSDGTIIDGRSADLARLEKSINRLKHRESKLRLREKAASAPRSKRHFRLQCRIARLQDRQANLRNEVTNQVAHAVALKHAFVGLEGLDIKGMTASAKGTVDAPGLNVRAKAGLNRAILNRGWGKLREKIESKVKIYGGQTVRVPPQYTSQTCAKCGHIAAENRDGVIFHCVKCGFTAHADVNAATNILEKALRLSAQESPGSGSLDGERPTELGSTTRQRVRKQKDTKTLGAPKATSRKGATAPRSTIRSLHVDMQVTSARVVPAPQEALATEIAQQMKALAKSEVDAAPRQKINRRRRSQTEVEVPTGSVE